MQSFKLLILAALFLFNTTPAFSEEETSVPGTKSNFKHWEQSLVRKKILPNNKPKTGFGKWEQSLKERGILPGNPPPVEMKSKIIIPGESINGTPKKLIIPGETTPGNPNSLIIPGEGRAGSPDHLVIPGDTKPGNPKDLVLPPESNVKTRQVIQSTTPPAPSRWARGKMLLKGFILSLPGSIAGTILGNETVDAAFDNGVVGVNSKNADEILTTDLANVEIAREDHSHWYDYYINFVFPTIVGSGVGALTTVATGGNVPAGVVTGVATMNAVAAVSSYVTSLPLQYIDRKLEDHLSRERLISLHLYYSLQIEQLNPELGKKMANLLMRDTFNNKEMSLADKVSILNMTLNTITAKKETK